MPSENFENYTLKNAFWRYIYTELRSQAISQVIISKDYQYKKILTLKSGPFCLWGPRYGPAIQ